MFYNYGFPFYRSPYAGFYGSSYPSWGYGGYGGYNSFSGINAVNSAVSTQSLVNTGTATGISQISTPSVIF